MLKALPGNPYDGHTLATIIPAIEDTIGVSLGKIVTDAGYRSYNAPKGKMFKVHVAGYKRGLTKVVKRALRRRAAVEPVIGHLKNDHRMRRNFLAFSEGDANNAVLAAVGYNFSLLLNWLRLCVPSSWRCSPPPQRRRSSHEQPNHLWTIQPGGCPFAGPVFPALIATAVSEIDVLHRRLPTVILARAIKGEGAGVRYAQPARS